ncbi:beta-N-acetylglucosaminidase domain-containing protein [Deinococcus arenicola]|uniref:Beta-N-acetylglucosaminidase domain-containing protein n=1 Tax=Deinococcus arenicola TaxID=2994950 RepID=A0ABU4DSM6_9DEIO|nr:beta-N-acetylglucosaminidase domain-containing protein [Deinococcus sp. ZS9-10]MDV6375437.1 beta-N-acetylglucosaminidase domain-containing protein [Deinococcus sp. ZS9-10]
MNAAFILGVIEGFYGRPWTPAQRGRLFGRMAAWGLTTYLYAPKDDRWHRQLWRDPYPAAEAQALRTLVEDARQHGIQFVYALSPGLDLDWSNEADRRALSEKMVGVRRLGVKHFSLLFDDIPYAADRAAQARDQVAATHHIVDALWPEGQTGLMLFCPTEYCGDRATPSVGEAPYLRVLGEGLRPGVDVLWTGPQVVSAVISVQSILEVNEVLRRRVLIWDNLHANDFTLHRVNLGPYGGRPLALRDHVAGILSNPNNQLEVNTPGLVSLADYAAGDPGWNPEASLDQALELWLPEFNTVPTQPVTLDDLRLVAHLLYLPGGVGTQAERLLETARQLIAPHTGAEEQAALAGELRTARQQVMGVLHALEAGPNRDLLFDLHPYLVDVMEEMQRLVVGATGRSSDDPQIYSYRGSFADRLMALGWDH